jgi:hypothetical protein
MSNDRDIGFAAFGFGFGIWSFFRGFMRLRRRRLIQNTPTSTIRGLAMGLVEIQGAISAPQILTTPLSKTECVVYKFMVEEYRRTGRSGHWATVASGDSFESPFWLDDGTGKIMVFPKGAEMIWPRDYFFETGIGKQIPDELISFLDWRGISQHNWLGTKTLRFSEWYIKERQVVYVLGSTRKTGKDPAESYKEELVKRLEVLKKDPEKMREVDTNKDGRISEEEWDGVLKKVEEELLTQAIKNSTQDNPLDIVITKGEGKQVFIISDNSEKDILGGLSREAVLGIFGGAALSLVTLAYLLFRFKIR